MAARGSARRRRGVVDGEGGRHEGGRHGRHHKLILLRRRRSEHGRKVDSAGSRLDCSDSLDGLLDLSPASISFASPSRGGCRWFTPAVAGGPVPGPLLLVSSKPSGPAPGAPLLRRVKATSISWRLRPTFLIWIIFYHFFINSIVSRVPYLSSRQGNSVSWRLRPPFSSGGPAGQRLGRVPGPCAAESLSSHKPCGCPRAPTGSGSL